MFGPEKFERKCVEKKLKLINFFNIHVIISSEAVSECRYGRQLCKLRTTLEPFLNSVLKNHGWEKARTVFL